MKKFFLICLGFVLVAFTAHKFTLRATPSVIMNKAMQKMQERGVPIHKFVLGERTTPQTQTVVRPSPDLAYSICMYDFTKSKQPLEIKAAYWRDYGSISFFDARTNNFSTVRVGVDGDERPASVLLMAQGIEAPANRPNNEQQIISPTARGLVLIRRLAPSAETYARVQMVSKQDKCQPLTE